MPKACGRGPETTWSGLFEEESKNMLTGYTAARLLCLAELTHNQMKLGICLEGVVERHQKGEIPDGLQNAAFGEGVLHHLSLPHDGGLLEHLHGKQLTLVLAVDHTYEKHFSIACTKKKNKKKTDSYMYHASTTLY